MAQPTSSPAERPAAGDRDTGHPDDAVLSWSDVLSLAPALGRLLVLTGQRLVDDTVGSASSTTRSVIAVVGDPRAPLLVLSIGRDRLVEMVREALGIAEIEATLRRLTGDEPGGAATALAAPPRGAIPAASVTASTTEPEVEAADDADEADLPHGSADEEADEGGEADEEADDVDAAPGPVQAPAAGPAPGAEPDRPELRERARQLLAQSATLDDDEQHPAFGVLLEELAPDEMRILRVFAHHGDQPVVDVESRGPLGGRGRLVAERVSLLSEVAGCKHPDRLPVYLDNLERLRLVRVDGEPLDVADYEVIEAQHGATSARDRGSRGAASARFLRRRLTLSAFGAAFCRCCLPG